jgi:hypothetical protein
MSIQSPKSRRSQEPGKREKDDGMREHSKGGTNPQHHNPAGSGRPKVPSGLKHDGGGHQGNVDAEAAVSVGSPAPSQAGGPKLVDKSKGDQNRTGGSVHQT